MLALCDMSLAYLTKQSIQGAHSYTMSAHQMYVLPDTLRNWPWKRSINSHYRATQAESVAWLESFKPLSVQAQIVFNKCDFSAYIFSAWNLANLTVDFGQASCVL